MKFIVEIIYPSELFRTPNVDETSELLTDFSVPNSRL